MAKLKKQLKAELKRLKLTLGASLAILLAVSVFSVMGIAMAGADGFSWLSVEADVADQIAASVVEPADEVLGAVASPWLPGPVFAVGMDQKFSVSMELADATSTWAIAVPFRASTSTASDVVVEYIVGTDNVGLTVPTTTVELVRINITSSTPSAFNIGCGSSASKFTTTTNGLAILTSDAVGAALGNVTIENGLATGAGAQIGGGSVTKIMLGPSHPYLVCVVDSAADGEWSGVDGVSPGNIAVRFSRVQ